MPSSYTLGKHFEVYIQAKLASGRYGNASEVVRDALRLMENRDNTELDAAIAEGIADADAGRVRDADEAFADVIAQLKALPDHAAE